MSADGAPPGAVRVPGIGSPRARARSPACSLAATARGRTSESRADRSSRCDRDHLRRACRHGRRLARAARGPRTAHARTACRWSRSVMRRRPRRRRTPRPRWASRSSSRPQRRVPTRPSRAASSSTCATVRASSGRRADRRTGRRPVLRHRGRRAARRRDPRPGLRAAGRVRPRRCVRRADRLDATRAGASHRCRCGRACRQRQGGTPGGRLARSSAGRSRPPSPTCCIGSPDWSNNTPR